MMQKSVLTKILCMALVCYAKLSADMPCNMALQPCISSCPEPSCGKVFVEGELLYWRAYQGGLADCISQTSTNLTTANGSINSRYTAKGKDPHFQWRPAYRVGAGFISTEGWDVVAYWTDFRSHANLQRSRLQSQHWKLHFQQADLLVGYTFCTSSCLTFRPFIGVRGAKIDRHLKACQLDSLYGAQQCEKSEFAGIGPEMGVEASLPLGCGFSVFAEAAVALLYGHNNVNVRRCQRTSDSLANYRLKQHLNSYQTALDAAIGIDFETCLCDSMQVIFSLSAEHHCYFDLNRRSSYGDLSLDGGTFSAAVAF